MDEFINHFVIQKAEQARTWKKLSLHRENLDSTALVTAHLRKSHHTPHIRHIFPTRSFRSIESRFASLARSSSSMPLSPVIVPRAHPISQALANTVSTPLVVNTGIAVTMALVGQRVLTPVGLVHAWALAMILWSCGGVAAWGLGVFYLVMGSAVTRFKKKEKEKLGIAEKRGGARGPENLWGSAATGALCAVALAVRQCGALAFCLPTLALLKIAFVASFATKLSDTFASEIGKAFGKRCFLITSLKPVPRGTEGAVSVEGTLAGVIGSSIVGVFGYATQLITSWQAFLVVNLAAFVATTFESYLGATVQDDLPWLTNEFINFINTLVGAALALLIGQVMGLA